MVSRARALNFNMRLSEAEKAMLDALAARRGLNASDWVRQAIRDAHERLAPSDQQSTSSTEAA